MSELTRCNYCTLKSIQKRYGEANVTVVTVRVGEMRGWEKVLVQGKAKPVAYFMLRTTRCVC